MATVNTTAIFPSARFISTDSLGDLQETLGAIATKAQLSHNGLVFQAVTAGEAGNSITLEIVGSNSAEGLEFTGTGNSITATFATSDGVPGTPEVPAEADELIHDGVTYSAVVAGANSGLLVTINESQAADAISYDSGTKTLTIDLDDLVTNKTQGDIQTLFTGAGSSVTDVFALSFADPLANLATTLTNEPLTGGVDYVAEVPSIPAVTIASYTQGQFATAFSSAPSAVTDLITLSVTDENAFMSSALAVTSFAGGAEQQGGSLDGNSDYILIKREDLYDLAADEVNDGRKVVWGFVHNATNAFLALSDPPTNFVMSKGNPIAIENGSALRQTYSIAAIYGVSGLDLRAES